MSGLFYGCDMQRLLRFIASQPWAMSREYVDAMLGVIEHRLIHGRLSAEEVDARIGGKRERQVRESPGNIALVSVRGVISNRAPLIEDISSPGGVSAEALDSQIRSALAEESVKSLILDIDSPGGAVGGTPELAETILSLRGNKPIVAQVNDLAASAAYWIASATDEIVAVPSAQVGSIGVIAVHEEISQMLENEGIRETIISAGKFKAEGNPFEPLSEEAREQFQSVVDAYYRMFVDGVAKSRGVDASTVRSDFGQGRAFIAEDARKAGMIDRVGTMRETMERLGARFESRGGTRERSRAVALEKRRLQLAQEA